MTTLFICWQAFAGVCLFSEEYHFTMPYLHQHPGHFECVTAKMLWIDMDHVGKEPEYVVCKKSA